MPADMASAQVPPADVRSLVDGAHLGTGFARIVGLAATPCIAPSPLRARARPQG